MLVMNNDEPNRNRQDLMKQSKEESPSDGQIQEMQIGRISQSLSCVHPEVDKKQSNLNGVDQSKHSDDQ